MPLYNAAHWGIYEISEASGGSHDSGSRIAIAPFSGDPAPSGIGLDQVTETVMRQRVKRPAVRRGWLESRKTGHPSRRRRGEDSFVEVSWDVAARLSAEELQRVRDTHGNRAIFGGSYGWASAGRFHHAQSQIHRFLNCIGGYVRHTESYSLGAGHVVMPHVVAPMATLIAQHTTWDVMAEHTQLFVAFGGVPTKNAQVSPGGVGRHRVGPGLQAMARGGTRFVNVSPVNDNLDAVETADWIRIRPNTDTALMLGLAWQLQAEGRHDRTFLDTYCTGYPTFEAYLRGETDGVAKTPEWASTITGVSAPTIRQLADAMSASRTMLSVAWSLQRAEFGEQPFWMLVTLAAMLGQIGLPGGGFGVGYGPANTMGTPFHALPGPSLPQGTNPVADFIPVARIADMLLNPGGTVSYNGRRLTYPDIRLVYWAGGNPFHHHQDLSRLAAAWQKPETVIVHEPYWTATAKRADIVLPVNTTLERNDIGNAKQEGVLVAMKQVAQAPGLALSDYDILSKIAAGMGVADAFTEGRRAEDWLRRMYDDLSERWKGDDIELPDFDAFWERGLVELPGRTRSIDMLGDFRNDPDLHRLDTPSGRIELFSEQIASFGLADCPGHPTWMAPTEWLGGPLADTYPLHLLTDQPARKLHSQLDCAPYSAAGKIAGREPIYMSPQDAADRRIEDGDVVEVFNARGCCLAAAVVADVMMPGVVRIATGAWYDPDETGRDKHGNPNVLTRDVGASSLSQGCAAQSCLVDVRLAVDPPPVTAFELPVFQADDGSML